MSTLIKEERRKFPALADREPDDLVQDFFVQKIEQVTVMLVTQATGDASVGKLLRRSIRHWLIDEARKTGTGPLRRSLEKILGGEAVFEQVPAGQSGAGRWRLAGTDAAPFGDDLEGLVQAARKVRDVRPQRWTSDTRRPPVADRRSIVAVLTAVLEAAGGSLETAQLVYVFSRRFAAALDPIEVSLDDAIQFGDVPSDEATGEDLVIAADSELDAACAAAEIVGRLSDDEKLTVPVWDDANAVRERLGVGRTQAYTAMDRVKKKVLDLAGTGPDTEQIVREVIRLCG
ncbi:hypothetical protein ILP97_42650 [Amycolatopsis sp. H6(2020)]|nr:hypothetical protein [Amycolatopsis sp. H6(2020)]